MSRVRQTGLDGPDREADGGASSGELGDLGASVLVHLEWLRDRAYARSTVYARRLHLRRFLEWCALRGLELPSDLTRGVLERYQRDLAHRPKTDGTPVALQTQSNYLVSVRAFCRWLARSRLVPHDPSAELVLPRLNDRVPRTILSPEEAERVLGAPDVSTGLGLRDRALLEMLYSTGTRRSELAKLALSDLDLGLGTVLIREGKNRRDRVVPVGERAMWWTRRYVDDVRPAFVKAPDDGVIFHSRHGRALVPNRVSQIVTKAVRASGIGKQASAHTFRHTAATAMLEAGADIRYIQQLLGHASLSSTQIYTRVSIRALKEVHAATHPTAKLSRGECTPTWHGRIRDEARTTPRRSGPTILLDEDE